MAQHYALRDNKLLQAPALAQRRLFIPCMGVVAWMNKERLEWIQERLREQVVLEDGFEEITLVGGGDVSYSGDAAFCTIAVLSYEDMSIVEERTVGAHTRFPYIPTYLSFREAGALIKAFRALEEKPDVLLIDGQGIAHPRGIGLASHVGVLLGEPTIGVAKNPLVGEYAMPIKPFEARSISYEGREVGFALKSRRGSKPIFVSPGHRVALGSSLEIVRRCLRGHRLPEPLRIAHRISKNTAMQRKAIESSGSWR